MPGDLAGRDQSDRVDPVPAECEPPPVRNAPPPRPTKGWLLLAVPFLGAVTLTVGFIMQHNGGAFVYPTDDPYIHLSIAHNLVAHGTFGTSAHTYASASSSPLWSLILSASMLVFGNREWLPLALNVVIGLVLCRQLAKLMPWEGVGRRVRGALACCIVIVASGAAAVAVIGMEHLLHAVLIIELLVLVERGRNGDLDRKGTWWLGIVMALATLTRFESLFVAAGCVVALLAFSSERVVNLQTAIQHPHKARARVRPAIAVVLGAVVPTVLFGVMNMALGGYFLPNSVVAKSSVGGNPLAFLISVDGQRELLHRLTVDPTLVALTAVGLALAVATGNHLRTRWTGALIALAIGAVLHVTFASVGRLDPYWARYDQYLIIAMIAILLASARDVPNTAWKRAAASALLVALCFVGISRVVLITRLPASSYEVAHQQLQTARFTERYYNGRTVMVNDLGQVSWRHQGEVVDLVGLGSTDVLRAIKDGRFNGAFAAQIAREHHADIAAVYPDWFHGNLPKTWIPVQRWCMDTPALITAGYHCITWYGTSPAAADELRRHLLDFADELPATVHERPPA